MKPCQIFKVVESFHENLLQACENPYATCANLNEVMKPLQNHAHNFETVVKPLQSLPKSRCNPYEALIETIKSIILNSLNSHDKACVTQGPELGSQLFERFLPEVSSVQETRLISEHMFSMSGSFRK